MNKKILSEARKLIAGFLKNRREELGMTQSDLAEICGVKWETISRIENGKFMPNLDLFLILTHHLNCYFFLESKDGDTDNVKAMRERWGKMNDN